MIRAASDRHPLFPVPSPYGRRNAPDGTVVPRVAQAAPPGGDDDASVVARGEIALTDLAVDPEAPSPAFGVAAGLAPRLQP